MSESELLKLDQDYPYKIVQSGVIGTERFDCPTKARRHFKEAETTALLSSYIDGIYKVMAYKFKI